MLGSLVIVVCLLVLSFITSSSEIAFFSLRPEDIDNLKNMNKERSRLALKLYDSPEKFLFTVIIIESILTILFVLFSYSLLCSLFTTINTQIISKIVFVISIFLVNLIVIEIFPKIYAPKRNVSIALIMAYPIALFELVFRPLTSLMSHSSTFIKKRVGVFKPNIMDELSDVLEQTTEELNEDEKILQGVVNFSETSANEIMCPRINVTAIDIESDFKDIIEIIKESGFSRIPVYSETFDNIKGVLYAKDILQYVGIANNFKWQDLIREPYFVPETKKINILLKEFQVKKIHLAIIIDEYGGTSGIVTLEDILEEIVGDITDESDEDEILYRKIDDNTYVFQGKMLLDDFMELLNLDDNIFDPIRGQAETLAGLILELTGEIPAEGQVVKYDKFVFIISSTDKRRITSIKVKINNDAVDKNDNEA